MDPAHAHSAPTKRILQAVRAAILCGIALGLAAPVQAGGYLDNSEPKTSDKPTWAVPAKRMPVEGDDTDAMMAELHNAELRVREAQQNEETARWTYTRARTRNYPRGEALVEVRTRLTEMEKERAEAEKSFVDLVERARTAGVPFGTLSSYMDLAEQIQSNPAKNTDD